ncbi:hypothetical protein [Epilithonimonas hispanica]|uniref:T9SS C-terminal target domain-containing protein n=1 Tax=Epilithonimonas hispanica TaxID=358687 RepID=A0A3D9CS80_9FLAO|nr:hypothetical protein [Epilithonimonas hispanica]REC68636.1 hypothetical protein DRF58_13570 [Epilithonimonas hispanica]
MIKKVFIAKLLLFYCVGFSQNKNILTYVGGSALVTVQSNTIVYNGGGFQTANTAVVNNSGNIMINGTSADGLKIDAGSTFKMVASTSAPATDYGQLYITGILQDDISGKVSKEYTSEFLNGNTTENTGRQQIGLPFYNFTIAELESIFGAGKLNVTNTTNNSSGRFNVASAFWWNNARARFDQIAYGGTAYDAAGSPNAAFIRPTTYYILPRRTAASTAAFWVPNGEIKTFVGTPVSDQLTTNVEVDLSGGYTGSFGTNGNGSNYFGEKYYSYIDDPFASKEPNWDDTGYARNLYQMSNPFLTNLDLKYIAQNEAGNLSDGNNITDLVGVAYYTSGNVSWAIRTGSTYSTALMVTLSAGYFQAGDTRATVIRPLGAFMVKLSSNTAQTINFNGTRRFKYSSRASGVPNGVSAARSSSENGDENGSTDDIPADKIVKQVAVVMYDQEGDELDRTYYAVSPSAITGKNELANLQAYSAEKKIYTREEQVDGGLDVNYGDNLYINEANEIDFKSKQIPLYIDYSDEPYQLKFEVYEKGDRVEDGLSNGNSFYFKNPQGQFIKIVDGASISMNGSHANLGLYYGEPVGSGTLGVDNFSNSQTIIAKKDANWVVRFAKNWKNANVEVYSAAGQLLHSKSQISTGSDYSIPLGSQIKSTFLVKATSEKGEVIIRKIINY